MWQDYSFDDDVDMDGYEAWRVQDLEPWKEFSRSETKSLTGQPACVLEYVYRKYTRRFADGDLFGCLRRKDLFQILQYLKCYPKTGVFWNDLKCTKYEFYKPGGLLAKIYRLSDVLDEIYWEDRL